MKKSRLSLFFFLLGIFGSLALFAKVSGVFAAATAAQVCAADLNQSGVVDLSDYTILVNNFFKNPLLNSRADVNGDGAVDLTDYSLLAASFLQQCVPSTTSVPGTTIVLLPTTAATVTAAPPSPTTHAHTDENSHAMGLWTPSKWDTCTKEFHDSFFVIGPDGKKYPTWHPPTAVDPATGKECSFGHEHGRDPKLSPFWSKIQQQYGYDANKNGTIDGTELETAGMPFGYVNEVYMDYTASIGKPNLMRHEDHVGHKLDWETGVSLDYTPTGGTVGGTGRQPTGVKCDYLAKAHQGTHSKDAFSNNLHEVVMMAQCTDGHDIRIAKLVQFGKAGEFTRLCDVNGVRQNSTITTGFSNTNPDYPGTTSSGGRQMMDRSCVEEIFLVPSGKFSGNFYEAWPFNMNLMKANGTKLVDTIDMLLDVEDAVRYYYPGKPYDLGYSMELCYEVEANGDRARGGLCDTVTKYGTVRDITWDDPRSGFRGLHRGFYFKPGSVYNTTGQTTWYTDPYGNNGQTTPFTGSIKQYIPAKSLEYGKKFGGVIEPSVIDRTHSGKGVHAPN